MIIGVEATFEKVRLKNGGKSHQIGRKKRGRGPLAQPHGLRRVAHGSRVWERSRSPLHASARAKPAGGAPASSCAARSFPGWVGTGGMTRMRSGPRRLLGDGAGYARAATIEAHGRRRHSAQMGMPLQAVPAAMSRAPLPAIAARNRR